MPDDKSCSIEELKSMVRAFAEARDWDRYHTAKNLSTALAVEAAELMEIFQWDDSADPPGLEPGGARRRAVEDELADIAAYLLRFCQVFGVDLTQAMREKLRRNAEKYPAGGSGGPKWRKPVTERGAG